MWHEVKVIGNAGKNPEMRYLPNGAPVTSFSVAANKTYTTSSGEKIKKTVWFRVSAFGKLAEIVNQYVVKGMLVLVCGELQPDKETGGPKVYESNGTWRSGYDLTASTVRFLSSNVDNSNDGQFVSDSSTPDDDELPF